MYHFISYSSADAAKFTLKLADALDAGPPAIPTWMDKRKLRPGEDWDAQIDHAIRTCDSLIFVMTQDSVEDASVCKHEWSRALKFKKPIVPVRLDSEADLPFRLGSRHYIDFSSSFDAGLASLRQHLQWLPTLAGQLQALKYRFADAQRDFRRATDGDKSRVEKEIEGLKSEMGRLEQIIQSPETAAAQTQRSIDARIESERQPPPRAKEDKRAKFVNPPPMLAPSYFQNRFVETEMIANFLKADSLRLMTLIGRGGVGKTTMICRLLKGLERGQLPDDLGDLEVGGIVYLSEIGTHRISFPNLFGDLCRLLPPEVATRLDQIYKDGQRLVPSKMLSLLEEFQEKRVVVLLDNLENIINPETRSLVQDDLREALRTVLEAPHHTVKIVVTTRIPPRDIMLVQPQRQQSLPLNGGLDSPYAEVLLRTLDADGTVGLKNAADSVLGKVRLQTRGFPRALEAFYGVLAADRSTTLEELLSQAEHTLPENVVEVLVGEAFSRLDKHAQMIMQTLAIYARPVPPVAVDFLLQPHLPAADSAPILNHLVNMHFVRKEQGRFYLHPVDLAYALSLIPLQNPSNGETQENTFYRPALKLRAAKYFRQIRRPHSEWKKLADVEPQLAEFEMRCAAEDYETALWLIDEIGGAYLCHWGHAQLVVELREYLKERLADERLVANNLMWLSYAYNQIGRSRKAIENSEKALRLTDDRALESMNLNELGVAYRRLGRISQAITYYEQALLIDRELHRSLGEANSLLYLAIAHRYSGLISNSIERCEESLEIDRRAENKRGEGPTLGNLSVCFRYLGQLEKAIEYAARGLEIARNENDKIWEGANSEFLSLAYYDLGEVARGSDFLDAALHIAEETADSYSQALRTIHLGNTRLLFGDPAAALIELEGAAKLSDEIENAHCQVESRIAMAMARLQIGKLQDALRDVESIRQTEYGIHLADILTLSGTIRLRLNRRDEAQVDFIKAGEHADHLLQHTPQLYGASESKGLAACGLALCESSKHVSAAIDSYRQARRIVSAPGVVRRALFFFDELAKADSQGILSTVRSDVEGERNRP